MAQPTFKIRLLGNFVILCDGKALTGVRLRSQQLLAYLIIQRQAPQPRRRIAGELWPDTQDSQARTNLRKELHHLRQSFPHFEQLIVITHQTLHWQPQVSCELDVTIFETALVKATEIHNNQKATLLETALNTYQGDFWPDCDADWIYLEQVRLRQQYRQGLAQITQLFQAQGNIPKAISWGQRWQQAEPLDESMYQTLMTIHGDGGDRATALRLYHQCMQQLQQELGVEPSPQTARIYQRLLSEESGEPANVADCSASSATHTADVLEGSIASPQPTPPAIPLVGREDILSTLDQWLFTPLGTAAPLLLLTGEPGIGKTRLLEALAERAQHQQWHQSWGRAFAAEQLRSYGVWIDLLREAPLAQDIHTLGMLLPELDDPPPSPHNRTQLLDAMVQFVTHGASVEQPLLLLFDDVHWFDDASTAVLHYVFRLVSQAPVRIVCAARQQELENNTAMLTLVQSLRRTQRLQEIAVKPLSAVAMASLITTVSTENQTQSPSPPLDAQQIYLDSGGNPLFALEAMRARTQGIADLSRLIQDRLHRLDGASRELLPWAAALGRRFNPEILAEAASYPPMQLFSIMEQLEKQQIIRPADEGGYDFVHNLVRQVAYDQLSQPRRRLVHGQLAKALANQTMDDDLASEVAYHAGQAGNRILAAQSSLKAAARSLRLFAYGDVLELVAQGLEHCQYLPSCDRILLSAQLLRTRVFAGVAATDASLLATQLQQLLTDMVGLAIPEAQVIAQETLAVLNYEQGNLTAVHEQSIKALDALPPSPRLQAESLAANGCCLAEIERDMDRAEAVLLEAQSLANRLGLTLSDIPSGLGCIERYHGDYHQAQIYFRQALQLAQNQQQPLQQSYNLKYLAMVGWDQHQPQVTDAQALLNLSVQFPQSSEVVFAQALIALSTYAASPNTSEILDQTLQKLDELDAQRKRVFVASHACELALTLRQNKAALYYAAMAHQAAGRVDHPNDLIVAGALYILSADAIEDYEQVKIFRQILKQTTIDSHHLSARARALRNRAQKTVLIANKD